MKNEIELIPNCSEAVFRIDVSKLSKKEVATVKRIWEEEVKKLDEEEFGEEGSELYSKKLFDKAVLEANGEFPYHAGDEIRAIVKKAEKELGKEIPSEFDEK